MKRCHSLVLPVAVACALAAAPGRSDAQTNAWPMKGLRVEMDWYESGKVKSLLVADFARPTGDGDIEALNPVVRLLLEDGTVETVLRAEQCRWNKERGVARSDSPVRMERQDIVVTGVGLIFNARNQVVRVLRNARVVSKRRLLDKFTLPGGKATQADGNGQQ